jgi:hypothetical protein
MQDSLNNPLGTPSLTAGDVMVQRLDASGAPVGRPALLFAENSRAFRVALARDGDNGWLVAWTGARTREGEVRGTLRAARVDANGALVGAALETNFSGPLGDGLRVLARDGSTPPRVAWSGEHCRERPELPRFAPPTRDPSAEIETRPRFVIQQGPLHEHPGPTITCDPLTLYSTSLRADGTLTPFVTGPALARDGLATVDGALIFSSRTAVATASLQLASIDADARVTAPRALVASGPLAPPLPQIAAPPSGDDTSAPTPSRVAPPQPPEATHALRAPIALDAARTRGESRSLVALSSTHNRVVLARFDTRSPATQSLALAPVERAYEVSLLGGADSDAPWLFVRVGIGVGGPLVYTAVEGVTGAQPEVVWQGDERLRTHLLRARTARAAVTDLEHTFGPVSARRDAATNPSMPGLVQSMRRLRTRWVDACDSLQARARFLVRRGLDRDLETMARQQCEVPPEPVMPVEGAAPAAVPAP